VVDGVTTPLRTVVDCARLLPFDEALAIADSALRSGLVTREELDEVRVRGAGAGAVRRVVRHADARAANPFESVLRALCIEAGLPVEPQREVVLGRDTIHPDLVCRDRRVVVEGDSWTWHATRKAHTKDCARYNLLTAHGWAVLRFTWEQVMLQPAYVRWVLALVGEERVARAEVGPGLARPA
jgi:very-short-patch-repair endonuclease